MMKRNGRKTRGLMSESCNLKNFSNHVGKSCRPIEKCFSSCKPTQ